MVAVVGQPAQFSFPVRDHLQLGEELDLIDFETGGVVRAALGFSGRLSGPARVQPATSPAHAVALPPLLHALRRCRAPSFTTCATRRPCWSWR